MASYYLNDVAIEDLGLSLVSGGPILPQLTINRERAPWQGRTGALLSPMSTVDPRTFRFVARGEVSTVAARQLLVDYFGDLLTGLIEVRDRDQPTMVMRGVSRVYDTSVESPSFVNIKPTVVVEIECENAARYDVTSTSRVLTSTPMPIPCGTLPHRGRFFVTGAAAGALSTETRIRYRHMNGEILNEMVLLPALASGEFFVVDADEQAIVHVSTGNVETTVEDYLTGGDYPVISPRHGNRRADVWPTLEITNGTALYVFRRHWKG